MLKEYVNFGTKTHLQKGVRENVPLENLCSLGLRLLNSIRCLHYFMSVSVQPTKAHSRFFKHPWLCGFCAAMILYLTTTFSFDQVHHQMIKMYNNYNIEN